MTVHVYGPRAGSKRFSGGQGIGIDHVRTDSDWVGIVGQAGDVRVCSAADLFAGHPQLGYAFQAVGGSVKVAFSCANTSLIETPGFSANSDYWGNEITVAPGSIQLKSDILFSMVRLTFVGTAELYIVTR